MVSNATKPLVLTNARIIDPAQGLDELGTIIVQDGKIVTAGTVAQNQGLPEGAKVIDCNGQVASPGLVDMRVFVGEPGFEHRETFRSASKAAAAGGVTTIITMPDCDPVIDDPALVDFILRRARDTAIINVHPMAAITKGLNGQQMTEVGLLCEAGAIAFTNGRTSIMNSMVMRRIMTYMKDFDTLLSHFTANSDLVSDGVMNESEVASRLGLPGIPREAETIQLERDLQLVNLTGVRYHASQISCEAAVASILRAKSLDLPISAATSINHLTLNENDIGSYRTFFRMSPPLRAESDRVAMVEALRNGTIDVIVSSHDPQDVETKRHPFAEAENGAIGLETLLPAALRMVHNEDVSLMTVLNALTNNPAKLLRLNAGSLKVGVPADIVVFDLNEPWILNENDIVSRSKNTPFEGARFQGRVKRTIVAGETVYEQKDD